MTTGNFEIARRKYAEKWGSPLDEADEPPQDEPLVETNWSDPGPSMESRYYLRHPERAPKPAAKHELKKTAQIAPGTYVEDYLPKLLEQAKTLMENHQRLAEKIDAFEQKQLDECTSKPNHVWLDGECVPVQGGILDPAPAPPTPAGMAKAFTKSSPSIDAVSGRPFCYDSKHMHGHRHIHEN